MVYFSIPRFFRVSALYAFGRQQGGKKINNNPNQQQQNKQFWEIRTYSQDLKKEPRPLLQYKHANSFIFTDGCINESHSREKKGIKEKN